MKFLYAVVMLALAIGAQASVIPWGSWDDGQWHGDVWDHGHWDGPWGSHAAVGSWGPHAALLTPGIALAQGPHHAAAVVHAPAVAVHVPSVAVHAPAALAVHAPALAAVHGAGSYVAKTRGAVHTAPLAGHVASVSSVNVAPAPGTH